jgi:nitroimidazol reductase NimA-like FMN-containing flavoprotein (pyridoxamine 5'-phosphate oxidase superfamily)
MDDQTTQTTIEQAEPVGDRPSIPGYGVPETTEGTLPWSHATERLERARIYWIGTASADGRPHAVPVWAAWLDGALYFGVGPRSIRNIAANPRVTVHLEGGGDDVVIVEGKVEPFADSDGTTFPRLAEAMAAKYDYRPDGPEGYVLRPRAAYAWTSFPADATRWRFVKR